MGIHNTVLWVLGASLAESFKRVLLSTMGNDDAVTSWVLLSPCSAITDGFMSRWKYVMFHIYTIVVEGSIGFGWLDAGTATLGGVIITLSRVGSSSAQRKKKKTK